MRWTGYNVLLHGDRDCLHQGWQRVQDSGQGTSEHSGHEIGIELSGEGNAFSPQGQFGFSDSGGEPVCSAIYSKM